MDAPPRVSVPNGCLLQMQLTNDFLEPSDSRFDFEQYRVATSVQTNI